MRHPGGRAHGRPHRDIFARLLVLVGEDCWRLLDEPLRRVPAKCVEVSGISTRVSEKWGMLEESHDPVERGDQCVFGAMDGRAKLVISCRISTRCPARPSGRLTVFGATGRPKRERRPLRGRLPHEFSQAWGDLSLR